MHVYRTHSLSGVQDITYEDIEQQVKAVTTHRNILELENKFLKEVEQTPVTVWNGDHDPDDIIFLSLTCTIGVSQRASSASPRDDDAVSSISH